MAKRREFRRRPADRPYRKLFLISAEGDKTEPFYFSLFNNQKTTIQVECLKGGTRSSPAAVLKRMKKRIKDKGIRSDDEAWLVVDKDQWTDEQLEELYAWAKEPNNRGFALSNPKFEFWLLLHFEDGKNIISRNCMDRLRQHLPEYDKGFDARKITQPMIADAVRRAKQRDNPLCANWPQTTGTTVYRLVEKLISILPD